MSRRTEKLARLVREAVSTAVLFEVRDPRVQNVTILGAEVAGDLRSAKVRFSVRGDEADEKLALYGLNSARGFLQSRINDKVDLRYTPILSFEIDHGVKRSLEASRILREIEEAEGPIADEAASDMNETASSAAESSRPDSDGTVDDGSVEEGNLEDGTVNSTDANAAPEPDRPAAAAPPPA